MADNWTKLELPKESGFSKGIVWTHKHNPHMSVNIFWTKDSHGLKIYHTHPAPHGHTIVQHPEHALNMKDAMKKAEMHLKHWNDPAKWAKDPDYGKLTNKP